MKSGFVTILGHANVGKSTILNGLVNQKISIVTDKSQTTRNVIKGIYRGQNSQIIFIDTPGIHKPKVKLGEEMNAMAYSSAHDADVNILVVDSTHPYGDGDDFLLEHLDIKNAPLIIVFNKIDQTTVDKVEKLKAIYRQKLPESHFIDTVASERFNLDLLIATVEKLLPEGPEYYPDGEVTDKDEIFQIKEVIREKILKILRDEVPHCVAVYIDNIDWDAKPIVIYASIIVEKDSQKGIVIGKNGKRIKQIGEKARNDIEKILKKHVYLELMVKVQKDWRNNDSLLETYGYKNKKN